MRTITHGYGIPKEYDYHRSSARMKENKQKKRETEKMVLANLAEFERLDNRKDVLTDDEYFRWVHLHPEWSAEVKHRFNN